MPNTSKKVLSFKVRLKLVLVSIDAGIGLCPYIVIVLKNKPSRKPGMAHFYFANC